MGPKAWLATLVAGVVSSFSAPVLGQAPEPSVVWYRGAEGCPGAEEFLDLLGELNSRARVAQAGDHVDFVVTFTATEGGVSGRLERQTSNGTVAIRELRDERCPTVAGALALGLQLALQADSTDAEVPAAAAGEEPDSAPAGGGSPSGAAAVPAPPVPPREVAPAGATAATPPVASPSGARAAAPAGTPPSRARARWSLESAAGFGTEQLSKPWPLGRVLFAGYRARSGPAFRGGILGGYGVRSGDSEAVGHALLAAHVDVCPGRFGGDRIGLWLCLGSELGWVRAAGRGEAGVVDGGPWLSAIGELSWRWHASERVGLQANGGVVVPATRYAVQAGADELYRTAGAGVRLSAGAVFRGP